MLHFQALAIYLSDPYRIQTCNLLIRSQTLYSIELRDQFFVFSGAKILPFFELASILTHFFQKKFLRPPQVGAIYHSTNLLGMGEGFQFRSHVASAQMTKITSAMNVASTRGLYFTT